MIPYNFESVYIEDVNWIAFEKDYCREIKNKDKT